MINDTDARETTRGDELLTGGSDPDPPEPDPLRERLREAYIAGYLERELDAREDDPTTQRVAERKAEKWLRTRGES
jgi:hypothetical protein